MRFVVPVLLLLCACGPSPQALAEKEARAGLELAKAGEVGAAVERFQRALSIDPDNAAARFNLGLAHLHGGQWILAMDEFERFTERLPEDAQGHFELARARILAGFSDAALVALGRAVELGFDDHRRLVEAELFAPLYRSPRWLALEMTVAQRAGVEPTGGVLALPGSEQVGRGSWAVPGVRMLPQKDCALAAAGGACLPQ